MTVRFIAVTLFYTICIYNISKSQLVHAEVNASSDNSNDGEGLCDANGMCSNNDKGQQLPTYKRSDRHCPAIGMELTHHTHQQSFSSAQAYKPNAPIKTAVCDEKQGVSNSMVHNVAHWPFWRSKYSNVVPLIVRGNVYSCSEPQTQNNEDVPILSTTTTNMEVWQPRPDGTYSSIRSGVEEGDCRASVPLTRTNDSDYSNLIGSVQYETYTPGSPGILGGLVPDSSREYPPYGPGSIHMYVNFKGHHPFIGQLNMNILEDWLLQKDSMGRFRFKGWDMRPHASGSAGSNNAGGIDVQSVKKVVRPGHDLAFEVELDIYLVSKNLREMPKGEETTASDMFCTSRDYFSFSWIASFFKEPIAICSPSLLDFFAL